MDIDYIEKNTGVKVVYEKVMLSTSLKAKEFAKENLQEYPILFLTDKQLEGRGTNGRVWQSDDAENILMTLLFYPSVTMKQLEDRSVTYKIAEAIKKSIIDLYDITLQIKEPNDLLLNDKKISGILTECKTRNETIVYLSIGIGFNVNQMDFGELNDIATSLKKEYLSRGFSREKIIVKIVNELEELFEI